MHEFKFAWGKAKLRQFDCVRLTTERNYHSTNSNSLCHMLPLHCSNISTRKLLDISTLNSTPKPTSCANISSNLSSALMKKICCLTRICNILSILKLISIVYLDTRQATSMPVFNLASMPLMVLDVVVVVVTTKLVQWKISLMQQDLFKLQGWDVKVFRHASSSPKWLGNMLCTVTGLDLNCSIDSLWKARC